MPEPVRGGVVTAAVVEVAVKNQAAVVLLRLPSPLHKTLTLSLSLCLSCLVIGMAGGGRRRVVPVGPMKAPLCWALSLRSWRPCAAEGEAESS